MKRLLHIILCMFLSGCGFHLRGFSEIPRWLDHVSIISQNVNRDLSPQLRNLLQNTSVRIDDEPKLANYWIILEDDSLNQQITSISSSTNARQYQMIYSVKFKLENLHSHKVNDSQTVTVTRQLTVNSERILGSSDEQSILETEMHQEAALLIFDRLCAENP